MKKIVLLYAALIIYVIFSIFWLVPGSIPMYNEVIHPLIWGAICLTAILLAWDSSQRVKDNTNKTQSLIIILILYIIVYFLLGLIFGYQRTPYSKEIISVIKNIWTFGSIIVFQEIVRNSVIKLEKNKKWNLVLITIILIIVNISFTNFMVNFENLKDAFIYSVTVLIPLIVTGIVLTYLSFIGGVKLPIIYRLFVVLPEFIVPIIPNFDWFMVAIIGVTLPIITFIYLNYIHINKEQDLSKREKKRYNPVVYVPVFIFIAVTAGFVMGLFKYQPVAVLSGSMSPTFNRGDAVVVRKLSDDEKKLLKENDVIQFVSGNKYVIHRIVEVDNDKYGNKLFVTKGDHNNGVDVNKVSLEQIRGKASFTVPYIGYPSVWLSGVAS